MVATIEDALKVRFYCRGNRQTGAVIQNLAVRLSRKEGARVYLRKVVAEEVDEPEMQIKLEDALEIRPDFHIGDIVEIDVTPDNFGRVATRPPNRCWCSASGKRNVARSMMNTSR